MEVAGKARPRSISTGPVTEKQRSTRVPQAQPVGRGSFCPWPVLLLAHSPLRRCSLHAPWPETKSPAATVVYPTDLSVKRRIRFQESLSPGFSDTDPNTSTSCLRLRNRERFGWWRRKLSTPTRNPGSVLFLKIRGIHYLMFSRTC